MKHLLIKLKESTISVAPIALTVIALGLAVGGFSGELIPQFFIGAVMLIIGMSLFNMGADVAMVETGNLIGAEITKSKRLGLVIAICFTLGLLITVAEPDLMVLAELLTGAVKSYLLIPAIGVGVGIFIAIAMLRIVFKISLRTLLIIFYSIVFLLALLLPEEFLPLSFDSGGVTTGPMTVPFIMALGVGIASSKTGSDMDDSFGIVALCSVGPIIATMILGLFADESALAEIRFEAHRPAEGIITPFLEGSPSYITEVAIALLPVIVFVAIFNFARLKLSNRKLAKIGVGFISVFVGLVIFLVGVNIGFAPAGQIIGANIVNSGYGWTLIPAGVLMGFFSVIAEPAVHVLIDQIEEISGGTIKKRQILLTLMIGAGIALGLSMTRVLTGISIWWIIVPGYAVAIILSFFSPKIFTAIAFDSGGVASGPMTAAFILPFAIGASVAAGGSVLKDAFGVVALAAMMPLIAIQIMGIVSKVRSAKFRQKSQPATEREVAYGGLPDGATNDSDDIIDFDEPEPVRDTVSPANSEVSPSAKPRKAKIASNKKTTKPNPPKGGKNER